MVGLTQVAHRPIGEFSKGMTRRIGLAQALINDPEFLILDEPTSGLDPIGTRQVKDLILDLGRRGKTILLSSHLLGDVEDVCDRIVVIRNGRIVSDGDPADLLRLRDEYDLRFRSDADGFAERLREFVTGAGGEVVSVRPATEDLTGLFLRLFEGT
jgi:ABC-2 type transport system ATP-binding protein